MTLQSAQAGYPERSLMFEPGRGLAQRPRLEATVMLPANDFATDQSGALKGLDVFGDGVERHRKGPGELADRCPLAGEGRENRAPCRIRHGREHLVERR